MKKDLLIVVPYRNREEHLQGFLQNSPKYFDKQELTYDVLICELDQQGDWNAGLSCNSVIDFIADKSYEWLYIHHVDVWPIDGKWKFPDNDNTVFFNMGDYGSCLMKLRTFLDVKGYSNSFWGWGGEDNELYGKLRQQGYNCVDISDLNFVKYNTTFQNHERKFNGINYANGIKNLCLLPESKKTNITNFVKCGYTKDLVNLSDNIYKHTVVPLLVSPDRFPNKKVVVGYLKGIDNPETLMPYVKSLMMHAPYEFDVIIGVADETPNKHLVEQLNAFGVKVHFHKVEDGDLFIDRFHCYENILKENKHYETVLHTDVTDVIFQKNPFDFISTDLVITSEEIQIDKETWNANALKGIYDQKTYNLIKDRYVLCGGIFGGPVHKFIEFCHKIIEEYKEVQSRGAFIHGIDQPLIQKIVYADKFKINIKRLHDGFGVNLHVVKYYPDLFAGLVNVNSTNVTNENHERFAVVHQINRFSDLHNTLYNHFVGCFFPI